ncbi:excinuclease ABC subunit C [Campylobacter ureolyticus]|nr:excinuclease ABC subunit C [Campylobacter ureolyticus]
MKKNNKKEYDLIIKDALYAIKNPTSMVEYLKELMLKYSLNENYEEAANLRDKIEILKEK